MYGITRNRAVILPVKCITLLATIMIYDGALFAVFLPVQSGAWSRVLIMQRIMSKVEDPAVTDADSDMVLRVFRERD